MTHTRFAFGSLWPRGRFSEYLVMGGLFAVTLVVYLFTLCSGVYPGESAAATAQALGLLPGMPVSHPLALTVSRMIAAVPILELPLRLNVVTAVCGSLSVALLFRIAYRTFFELIRPVPSIRLIPVADGSDASETEQLAANDDGAEESDAREQLGALLGGGVCALVFAFGVPFWVASTSLHMQPYDLLLFLVTVDVLLSYVFSGRLAFCLAAAFLCGLLVIESSVALLLLPLLGGTVICACLKYEQLSESFLLSVLAVGLAGLGLGFGIVWLQAQGVAPADASQVALAFGRSYKETLLGLAPRADALVAFGLPLVCLLLAGVGLRRATFCREEVVLRKWQIVNVLCTAAMIAELLNVQKTVWGIARTGAQLPILPALAVACVVGLLFVYWFQTATVSACNEDGDLADPPAWRRLGGAFACGLLVIVALRAAGMNVADADGKKAGFADAVAKELLTQVPEACCLVTDGTLDLNLLILSHLSGGALALIPAESAVRATSAEGAPRLVFARQGKGGGVDAESQVLEWLRANPGRHGLVAAVGTPALWRQAGLVAVPQGLLYVGARESEMPDLSAVYSANREVWQRVAPLLKDDPSLVPALRRVQSALRTHVSRLANDMGVALDRAQRAPDADTAYTLALALDGNNFSAALNRHSLRVRQRTEGPGVDDLLAEHPALRADPSHFGYALAAAEARYGEVYRQPADLFLPALLASSPRGGALPQSVAKLYAAWLTPRQDGAARAPQPLEQAEEASATVPNVAGQSNAGTKDFSPELRRAVQAHAEGRDHEADRMVRRVVTNHPANQTAMTFLAELLLSRGAREEVSSLILPAMRATAAGIESPLVLTVQGGVCMRMEPSRLLEARACFKRALELNRRLASAQDWLLEVDQRLQNDEASEADALFVIQENPSHATAHAILGRVKLAQAQTHEAEAHFRASLARSPSAECHSELSALLRQQSELVEAEQQARSAVRLDPCHHEAWETLGGVLMDLGRLDEASDALQSAVALNHAEAAAYLPLIKLRLKQGRTGEADQLLQFAERRLGQVSAPERAAFDAVREKLRTAARQVARTAGGSASEGSAALAQVSQRK